MVLEKVYGTIYHSCDFIEIRPMIKCTAEHDVYTANKQILSVHQTGLEGKQHSFPITGLEGKQHSFPITGLEGKQHHHSNQTPVVTSHNGLN